MYLVGESYWVITLRWRVNCIFFISFVFVVEFSGVDSQYIVDYVVIVHIMDNWCKFEFISTPDTTLTSDSACACVSRPHALKVLADLIHNSSLPIHPDWLILLSVNAAPQSAQEFCSGGSCMSPSDFKFMCASFGVWLVSFPLQLQPYFTCHAIKTQ